MPTSTVTDAATGQLVFESVGHLFRAAACLDSNGISRPGTCGAEERDFRACASSECHTSQEQARSLFTLFRRLLERRLDEIWFDSNGNHVIDPSTTDGGLLPRVVAQGNPFELDLRDEVVTVAEGALWNAQLAHTSTRPWFGDGRVFGQSFSATRASGGGTHNPWLLHALLVESIEALIKEYDL
jgi:hypothetical protein